MSNGAPRQLKLGDELSGTVVKAFGGNRFGIKSNHVPRGWKVELHSRNPEYIDVGGHIQFWVGRIMPVKAEVLVYEGDFGRLPVSDAMRERYAIAVEALLGKQELTGDILGDAKSMIERIGSHRQADWLTVWRLLGEPDTGDVKVMLAEIDAIRGARKSEPQLVEGLISRFAIAHRSRLNKAYRRLTN